MSHYLSNGAGIIAGRFNRRPAFRRRGRGLAAFLLFALCAEGQSASEYQIKAAYLYNFAKLATFPERNLPSRSSPLVIGIVAGDDEFVDMLTMTVDGRSIENRPISVRRVSSDVDVKSCQLVFVRSSAGRKRTQASISAGAAAGVLLVGEDDGFLREGGMINLLLQNGKIRFVLNREALDLAGIRLSQELLQLAKSEEGPPRSEEHGKRRLRVAEPPPYPELARKMHLFGTVNAEADVRRDGTVRAVRVLGGNPVLAEALSRAIMNWRYEPAAEETIEPVHYTFDQ